MAEDYYKTLGVARDASQDDIKKAYRGLARKFHPDMNPDDKNAKEKFQKIQAAFDVLSDPSKREMFDRYGSSFESAGSRGSAGPQPGGGFEDFDFSQFFGERFGGGAGGGGGAAGASPFADIFGQFRRGGGRRSAKGSRTAARPGTDFRSQIEVPFTVATSGGQVQLAVPRSSGKTDTITVKIPPGINDGATIRLRGQGEAAEPGGPAGDILLTVHVAAHPFFHRRGDQLEVKTPVTLAEAVLGAKIDLPTPSGVISLRIPPRTSSGTRLRLKGMGVVGKDGKKGDLFAEIQIVLPANIDSAAEEAIKKLAERNPQNPRADLKW